MAIINSIIAIAMNEHKVYSHCKCIIAGDTDGFVFLYINDEKKVTVWEMSSCNNFSQIVNVVLKS